MRRNEKELEALRGLRGTLRAALDRADEDEDIVGELWSILGPYGNEVDAAPRAAPGLVPGRAPQAANDGQRAARDVLERLGKLRDRLRARFGFDDSE